MSVDFLRAPILGVVLATHFILISARHPAALLSGDEDLHALQGLIGHAEEESGEDWLLWLGDEIPRPILGCLSEDIKQYTATPKTVLGAMADIQEEICHLADIAHLKIIIAAPLVFADNGWWIVGTAGAGSLLGDGLAGDAQKDSYFFHLETLLARLVPSVDSPFDRHVIFHRYRLWGPTPAERLPIDMPNQAALLALESSLSPLGDVQYDLSPDDEWTPASGLTPKPVEPGPGVTAKRPRDLLADHTLPTKAFQGPICLVGSERDLDGWLGKLKALLNKLGVDSLVGTYAFYGSLPAETTPGLIVFLRAEALTIGGVQRWLEGLSKEIPVVVLDEQAESLRRWKFEDCLGESMIVRQALRLAALCGNHGRRESWKIDHISRELADELFPGRDEQKKLVWRELRARFGSKTIRKATDKFAVRENLRIVLLKRQNKFLSAVVELYDEKGLLFYNLDKELHVRRAPAACLSVLGSHSKPEIGEAQVAHESPKSSTPCLGIHGADSRRTVRELSGRWLTYFPSVISPRHQRRAKALRASLAKSSCFVQVVPIDLKGVDLTQVEKELRAARGLKLPYVLVEVAASQEEKSPRLLDRIWGGAPRMRLIEREQGHISEALSEEAFEGGDELFRRARLAPWVKFLSDVFPKRRLVRPLLKSAGLRPKEFELLKDVTETWLGIVFQLGESVQELGAMVLEDQNLIDFHQEAHHLMARTASLRAEGVSAMRKASVFISYSHRDLEWKGRLAKHLRVLERQGLLETWDDGCIGPGEDWREAIESALRRTKLAVLLVSANFLTSEFISDTEVPEILNRQVKEGLCVYPVLLQPCAWRKVPWLSRMQLRPFGALPLASKDENEQEAALAAIAEEIDDLLRA